jgi:hypothetical protein
MHLVRAPPFSACAAVALRTVHRHCCSCTLCGGGSSDQHIELLARSAADRSSDMRWGEKGIAATPSLLVKKRGFISVAFDTALPRGFRDLSKYFTMPGMLTGSRRFGA